MAADNRLGAAIALTRLGLGARPGELEAAADPPGWLKAQIRRRGADQPQGRFPSVGEGMTILTEMRRQTTALRRGELEGDPQALRRMALEPVRTAHLEEIQARGRLGATTPNGFRERWALFWANHFTVAVRGVQLTPAVAPFEREAIRPHVFRRFADLLTAATRHPGMLLYLDQAQSTGPASPMGRRGARGLNENLAREILELHTVGADAGYVQADVTEFARALTGWSVTGADEGREAGVFVFRAAMHEPGARRVMERSYPPGGEDQALAILHDLAAHPATGRRLARKLAAYFVADAPPDSLVLRLEAAWTASDGDLAKVAEALIDAPETWTPRPAKLKTPYEFVVSAYRALGTTPGPEARDLVQPLSVMGQRPFAAPQPDGWPDRAADWAAPDAMIKRLAWTRAFAARSDADPLAAADSALGPRLSPATRQAMAHAGSSRDALALLLMSPEFQRR